MRTPILLKFHCDSIADYDEAIRLEPSYLLALLRRADTYPETQQYARALEGYNQAIALKP